MKALPPGLDKLSAEQREHLAQRLLRRTRAAGSEEIPRHSGAGPCRLSFAQQRLWFLDQLHPGNSAYNVYRAVRICGPLDRDALRRSLDELVRRHEPLRTTVRLHDGIPHQVVAAPAAVPLPVVDLSECPEGEREAVVLRRANEEGHRAFDLSADLLLRTTLLHLGPQEHALLLTTHHLAADGWSVGILFSDLSALYEVFTAGAPSPLPELAVRYVDFAEWQRQNAEGPALRPHLEFWRRQLAGAPAALDLPTDRPRPARQALENFRGARHYFLMPRPLLDAVTTLARNEGVTLFMTLLAAFQALLARYSGQDDIVVGSPIAGRNRPELEPLVGCFSNTLVLRTSLAGNPSFHELLGRARETALGAFANQDVPFEKLVEELRPPRFANRTPLFQVNFRLLTAPLPPLKLSGLDLRFLEVDNRMAKFDLALELCARTEGLGGYVEYFADLYDPPTVRRMAGDFEELLGAIAARPDVPLGTLAPRGRAGNGRPAGGNVMSEPPARKCLGSVRRQAVGLGGAAAPAIPPPGNGESRHAKYSLRKATLKDSAFIYHVRSLTMEGYLKAQYPHWTPEQLEAYFLDFDPAVTWIVVVDGKDVGSWAIVHKETETVFANLHLLPECQGKGIGTAVLLDAIAVEEKRGLPITGQVLKSNPVLRLYQRVGFVITEESEDRYQIRRPVAAPAAPTTTERATAPRGIRAVRRKGIDLPS